MMQLSKNQNSIIAGILVFLIAGIGGIFYAMKTKVKNQLHATDISVNDTTVYRTDKQGKNHAEKQEIVADLPTIEALRKHLIDSIVKAVGAKPGDVKTAVAFSTQTSDEVPIRIDTVYVDSGKHKSIQFSYSDRWLSLKGDLYKKTARYEYNDSFIVVGYNKRTGFLNLGRTPYINAYSINPHTHVKGLTAVRIESMKPKKFSLGVGVGYGYNGARFEPMIGVQLQYSLIRF